MHLNIAVARSLISQRDKCLKTAGLGNEIIYNCHSSNSIQASFDKFGIKNCKNGFFAIFVDCTETDQKMLKEKISSQSNGEVLDLNKHIEYQDLSQIIALFELKDKEMALPMPNAFLTCIYNRLALKNI